MRVIYNKCFADPWVKVAQKLQQMHGYEPVYWIGYSHDDSEKLVPNAFSNVIYHSIIDALKSFFPKDIADRFALSHINIDFLKDHASHELQAIKMMDRMDLDRYSFNFMERQMCFRNYLKYWTACINFLKPDLVVSGNIPHNVFDYILYLVCKYHNVKFVTFCWSAFLGRVVPVTDISTVGDILDEEYARIRKSDEGIDSLKRSLPSEIIESYEKTKSDYASAVPDYMKQQLIEHNRSSSFFRLAKKFFLDVYRSRYKYFGEHGFIINGMPIIFKQRSKRIKNSKMTVLAYSIYKLKANSYKNKLNKYYNLKVVEPDFTVPYVIFNLHYQPEVSTSPAGDIFVDQLLCIEMLAKTIPADFMIYVKEHPSQFYSQEDGHTGRVLEFYDGLLAFPQVRLLPIEIDPFLLIKNSKAVATVTGTSGWEAMVLGKPVINFGLSWYEKYSGVLKIVDEKTASKITQFIKNFKFDERDLLAYLNAFSKKSIKAYAHPGNKEKMTQDEMECVSNLAESIIQMASRC